MSSPADSAARRRDPLHAVAGWLPAVVAGVAAFVVRLLYVLDIQAHNVLFDAPIMDGAVHDGWARGTIDLFFANIPYFRAPLYPWFLQTIYAVDAGYLAPRIVQAVCAALTVALVADTGRRLAGPLAGVLGGLLLALHWPGIYFTGELLIVTPFMLLVMLSLWSFVRAGLEDAPLWAWVGACALGLSAIARPTSLTFLPVLVVMVWWVWPRIGATRLAAARVPLVVGLLLVTLAPGLALTVRNKVVGDDWVFIASQGGVNFYIGNNAQSDGRTAVVPGTRPTWLGGYEDTIRNAEMEAGRPLEPSAVSRHYLRKGMKFWVEEPGAALKLYGRKLRLLLGAGERSNNQNIHFWRSQSSLLRAPIWLSWAAMFSLGVVGLVLLRRRAYAVPVWGYLAAYAVGLLLFFINERFRYPLVPALAVFAGVPISTLIQSIRRRAWISVGGIAVAVGAIYGLTSLDRLDFRENRTDADAFSRYTMANAYLKKGQPEIAEELYREAVSVARYHHLRGFEQVEPMLQINLVRAMLEQLKLAEVEAELTELDKRMPNEFAVRLLWGQLYRAQHNNRRAFRYFRDLAQDFPQSWEAQVGLGWCQLRNRAYQTSINTFDKVLELHPGQPDALAGKGAAEMIGRDNPEVARRLLERALAADPTVAEAHHFLGEYYYRHDKNPEKMVLHLREALRLDPYNNDVRRFMQRNRIPTDTPRPGALQP